MIHFITKSSDLNSSFWIIKTTGLLIKLGYTVFIRSALIVPKMADQTRTKKALTQHEESILERI